MVIQESFVKPLKFFWISILERAMSELISHKRFPYYESPSIDILICPWGFGGTDNLAQEGGHSLLVEKEILWRLQTIGCRVNIIETHELGPFHIQEEVDRIRNIEAVNQVNHWLAQQTQNSANRGHIPLVFGGDGSLCIGSVAGLTKSINNQADNELGVIWFSNHLCNSAPSVTKSWNANRMAFTAMSYETNLSECHWDFRSLIETHIKEPPILRGQNITHIGINHKSAMQDAWHNFYSMEDIEELGAREVFNLALEDLEHCKKIHIIWDVNALDLSGVSNYSLGQMNYREAISIAREIDLKLRRTGKLSSMDIVEHCPSREAWDKRGETAEWMTDIITNCFGETIFNAARRY
jgi:arginase